MRTITIAGAVAVSSILSFAVGRLSSPAELHAQSGPAASNNSPERRAQLVFYSVADIAVRSTTGVYSPENCSDVSVIPAVSQLNNTSPRVEGVLVVCERE
jgi:hypothetical protein